jgi:drug/metabolite transporter (DMT)-like permease
MLLLGNFYWGLSFPVIKAALLTQARLLPGAAGSFSTAAVLAPRFLLAFALLALWRRWRPAGPPGGLSRGELRQGLILGSCATGGMLLQIDGLRFTAATTSAFLTQFYAILIPIWLAVRRRRLPGSSTLGSCILVLAGVAILGNFDWSQLRLGRGEWETLGASLFFMVQVLCLANPKYAANRPREITLVLFATEGAAFTALAVATTPSLGALAVLAASGPWVGMTLVLAVFCTVGAFSLMNAWQPRITATEAGLIYCAEPVFASVLALFLPALLSRWAGIAYANEQASTGLVVGGGLITLANLLVQLGPDPD